jgi:tetratricopeptide (TPR) repeat protein
MLNVGLKYLPREAELYLVRGVLYCQLGDTSKGIADFETADRLNPKLSFPGIAEGIAESQAHKSGEALSTFRVQAQKHPNDALAQYLFAEALSEHGDLEGGLENREEVRAAKLAVKLDPTLSAAHDLLATNYLRARKTELAIHESQEALKNDPSDQQALYHLILAMRKSGNKEETRVLVEHLLKARNVDQAGTKPLQRLQIIEIPTSSSSLVHSH